MIQGFDPNDLVISHASADRPSVRPKGRTDGSPSFSEALENASARVASDAKKQEDDSGHQTTVESSRVERKQDQVTQTAPVREHRPQKGEKVEQQQVEETQTDTKTTDATSSPETQKEEPRPTEAPVKTQETEVAVERSWKDS